MTDSIGEPKLGDYGSKKLEVKKKKRFNRVIFIAIFLIILLIFIPPIVLLVFLNRHVDYKGCETKKYPLQGIYEARDYGLDETQMFIETKDGYNLWCSEITTENPKGVIIYLSGIVQPSVTYFYGHSVWMLENGYASILLEVRSHGNSEGNQIGLGYTETSDVKAVVDYLKSCGRYNNVPIIIHGVSMGGAIALNAFGQITDIDACIAMSAYSAFENQLDLQLAGFNIPSFIRKIEVPILTKALEMNYGSKIVENMTPEKQIKNADDRPVLLIACSGDVSVSYKNTYVLKEAYPQADVWIRDSWEHFIIQECDFKNVANDKEYCKRILEFLKECDNGDKADGR